MKRTVRGKDELVLTGVELIEKLVRCTARAASCEAAAYPAAVLVPPPRVHLVRFHGVFAPNAKLRAQVVPEPPAKVARSIDEVDIPLPPPRPDAYRIDWASLLKRVYAVDVLECGRCQGRMRVLAVIDEPAVVKKILEHLGLPAIALETARARGPPQPRLTFDAA